MGGKKTVAERTQLASQGGARYRVRTCDPYRVNIVSCNISWHFSVGSLL
jgi:hypothetical protein